MKYEELVQQIQEIDASLAKRAASAVNVSLNIRNWMIGRWIVEYEQNGSDRAKYGDKVVQNLAESVHPTVKGLSIPNLKRCRQLEFEFESKIARDSDPVTSHEAAADIQSDLSRLRAWAVECVTAYPGKTSQELALIFCPGDERRIGRRLGECARMGRIRRTGPRYCSVTGKRAATWEPV